MIQNPNIIYIYADDLGRGMLSCYGQKNFETPNIDRIDDEGIKFEYAYGCAFCAPARASLLTGYHDCHAGRWTFTTGGVYNKISSGEMNYSTLRELINNTSFQEREDEVFLPHIAKKAGYTTGQIGKLEWGFATTAERLEKHGWDYHFGYYDHQRCHGYYPPFLFENGEIIEIEGNTRMDCGIHPDMDQPEYEAIRQDMTGKKVYSQDLFNEKILNFIRKHKNEPFFLYHPTQLPHGPISIPEVSPQVKENEKLTQYEKEYASMVIKLDETVGLILDELDRLNLADNTMVIFSSDNGHEVYYRKKGRCPGRIEDKNGRKYDNIDYKFNSDLGGDIFNGNDGMSGLKFSSWEGGTRIPYIIRWPRVIKPNTTTNHMMANYDFMATLADILGVELPSWKDGISYYSILQNKESDQIKHDYIVYGSNEGPALISHDGWKIRYILKANRFQLFNIYDDYREENDLSGKYPEKVKELGEKMLKACDGNFNNGTADIHKAFRIDEYIK